MWQRPMDYGEEDGGRWANCVKAAGGECGVPALVPIFGTLGSKGTKQTKRGHMENNQELRHRSDEQEQWAIMAKAKQ